MYDIGCFFGAIGAVMVGDYLGRKKTILIGTTIMTIGAIMQIAAFNVPVMMAGRIIAGIGNGLNTSTAPVWQSETSKASWRGKLVVIEMILNIAGFPYRTGSLTVSLFLEVLSHSVAHLHSNSSSSSSYSALSLGFQNRLAGS